MQRDRSKQPTVDGWYNRDHISGGTFIRRRMKGGILTGEIELRKSCKIAITSDANARTMVHEIFPGMVAVSTTGESLSLLCTGRAERRLRMASGVFIVDVPVGCRLNGVGFAVPGLTYRTMELAIKTTVIRIKPFHLHTTVTTDTVARHLKGPQWSALGTVKDIQLSSLDDDPKDYFNITRGTHSDHISWVALIIIIVVTIGVISVRVFRCVQRKRQEARRFPRLERTRRRAWRRRRTQAGSGQESPGVELSLRGASPAAPERLRTCDDETIGTDGYLIPTTAAGATAAAGATTAAGATAAAVATIAARATARVHEGDLRPPSSVVYSTIDEVYRDVRATPPGRYLTCGTPPSSHSEALHARPLTATMTSGRDTTSRYTTATIERLPTSGRTTSGRTATSGRATATIERLLTSGPL